MPYFSSCCPEADEYICQICGVIKCSACQPSAWRPDLTKNISAGNACPSCVKGTTKDMSKTISLFEHCRQESGLSNSANEKLCDENGVELDINF